jgi:SAM-dependent methyltransferase
LRGEHVDTATGAPYWHPATHILSGVDEAPGRPLTDTAFWRAYWDDRPLKPLPGSRFFYADLLRRTVAGRGYRSLIELGGYPGIFAAWARRELAFEDVALLDRFVDEESVHAFLAANGLSPDAVSLIEADMFGVEVTRHYDVVLSAGLLEHFDDPKPVLARHLDFLAPGGTLLVTVPNFRGINGWVQRWFDPELLRAHNLETMDPVRLRAILEELDLTGRVYFYGGFRVWLERFDERRLPTRVFVLALRGFGRAFDLLQIRTRLTARDVVIEARRA